MKPERVTVTSIKDGKNHVGAYDPKTKVVVIVNGEKLTEKDYKDLRPAPIVK